MGVPILKLICLIVKLSSVLLLLVYCAGQCSMCFQCVSMYWCLCVTKKNSDE